MTSRVCRALSAFALFLGAAGLLPGSPPAEAASSGTRQVQVGISSVSPQIPDFTNFNKKMTFSGKVLNTGASPLKNVYLKLYRSLVYSQADMGSADGEGFKLDTVTPFKVSALTAGTAQSWQFSLSETDFFGSHNPQDGVYAVDVDAFDEDGRFLGGQRTYTVWKPARVKDAKPARVALLWPVVGQPGLTGQKMPNTAATVPILPDQSAADQFAPNGRLSRILQDASGLSVNWLVDPDVLYTANELGNSFFYSTPNPDPKSTTKTTLTGANGTDAKNWYTQALAQITATQNCWNLLTGDPDLNTLSRTPTGQSLLNAAVGVPIPVTTGGCRQGNPTIAWPSDGQADAATLAAIAAAKVPNLVTLVGSNQTSGRPSAHASLPNSPNTVVYDNALSNVFADPAKTAQPPLSDTGVLAGQQWLAQTALAATQGSGILVVTPPRDFDPAPKLLEAIKAVNAVAPGDQWFGLENLGKVLNDTPAKPERLTTLTKIATPNLANSVVNSASDSHQLYRALHSIMPPAHSYDAAVPFRPVATWWRNHGGGQAYAQAVYSTVVTDHGLVSFGQQSPPLTMSGKSGTVPVTINNKTDTTIRVYLRAQGQGAYAMDLKVKEDQGPQTVESGQSATIRIPVQALGNGQQVTLGATLYTCADLSEDCTYYPSNLINRINDSGGFTKVTVKVSRIGIIALGLMIGSGILLVLLIGLRVYRAKSTHHVPAQDTMAS